MTRSVALVAILCVLCGAVQAGRSSQTFDVGITITDTGASGPAADNSGATYTWGAAEITLLREGFVTPTRREQSQGVYWFEATRNGAAYRVAVSASTGAIVQIVAL